MDRKAVKIVGLENRAAFHKLVDAVEGGVVSPGGAAMMVGYSRQRIYQLIDGEEVRSWAFYERGRDRHPSEQYVSLRDLLKHAIRVGKVREADDLRMSWPTRQEEFDRCKAEVLELQSKA